MYHIDCDTIPYLWAYANRFTLFDNFYQALRAPSTPSNVEIIAAQNGLTQYARSPKERSKGIDEPGDPIFTDLDPAFGPYDNGTTPKHTQINQTYATILLSAQRRNVSAVTANTDDVRAKQRHREIERRRDSVALVRRGVRRQKPRRTRRASRGAAWDYFGYVAKNPGMNSNVRDITAFYGDVSHGRLPDRGLFYLKGGSHNALGLRTRKSRSIRTEDFLGDDDHPAIPIRKFPRRSSHRWFRRSRTANYAHDSAIVIAWDDLGGFFGITSRRKTLNAAPTGIPAATVRAFRRS